MNFIRRLELAKVDETLTELAQQRRDAPRADKPFIMARIDFWLDQRLKLMR